MKVRVCRFQSLDDVSIEIEGLTVVTGPSNIGKSALVRAFVAAVTNRKGNKFIANGAEFTDVLIEKSQENSVRWIKGEGLTEYHVDGVINKKAGKSNMTADIAASLGIYPISAQGGLYYPQIQRQFDKPFIVSENSPTVAAELLAANKHSQVLTGAIKLAGKDGSKKSTEIEILDGQVKTLKARLILAEQSVPELIRLKDSANLENAEIQRVRSRINSLTLLHEKFVRYNTVLISVAQAPAVPPPQLPAPGKTPPLRALLNRWKQSKLVLEVAIKDPPPQMEGTIGVAAQLKNVSQRHQRVASFLAKYSQLPAYPSDTEIRVARSRIESMKALHSKRESLVGSLELANRNMEEIQREQVALEKQRHEAWDELGICPLCKSPVKSPTLASS